MHASVGTQAFAVTVGIQLERPTLTEIVARDRHVARVGLDRGPGAPQQVALDAALVGDEVDAEFGPQRPQLLGGLDPTFGRDEEVALWGVRELRGGPIAFGRRALLGRGW